MLRSLDYEKFHAKLVEKHLLEVLESVCRVFHVQLHEVYSHLKTKSITNARAACWSAMADRGSSHLEIGTLWSRDHSSVHHGIVRHHRRQGGERGRSDADRDTQRIVQLELRVNVYEDRITALERRLAAVANALL